MADLVPENFRESLSAIFFLIAVVFSFWSLSDKKKTHALRLAGLFVLSALALFGNNTWCYFAAIFIVATAVTQLEFLQNLAAIIRGSKEYFDYQKEFLSQKEIEESASKEVAELQESTGAGITAGRDVQISLDKSRISMQQFYVICEEYAFRYLERKHERPIQRHIRYRGKGMYTEFDGVMQLDDKDIIFELKVTRDRVFPPALIKRTTDRIIDRVKAYSLLTGRKAELRIVLIGTLSNTGKAAARDAFVDFSDRLEGLTLSFDILSLEEIGLPGLEKAPDAEQLNSPDEDKARR